MPTFSIIIALYNKEAFVEEALNSCLGQTVQDLEIIIVDDESTDGSVKKVQAMMAKDKRIQLLFQKNQGPAAARNTGLAVAKGTYISFFDADDVLEKNYLEVLHAALEKANVGLAMCNASVVDERGVLIRPKLTDETRFDGHPRLQDAIFCQGLWPPSILLIRRQDAQKIGGFYVHPQTRICEDWEFMTRLGRSGLDYTLVPLSLVRYRQVSGSLGSNPEKTLQAHCLILAKLMRDDPDASAQSLFHVQKQLGKARSEAYAQRQILKDSGSFLKNAIKLMCCGNFKEVLIWGAGSGGQRVLKLLQASGTRVKGFVDSNPAKAGQTVAGLPIVSPESFLHLAQDRRPYVIIASSYAPVIQTQMENAGWTSDDFYNVDFDLVTALEEVWALPAPCAS